MPGFGTDYGVCVWLSTYYTNPQPGSEGELSMLPTGALNGENNGLSLLLDAGNILKITFETKMCTLSRENQTVVCH